MRALRCVVRKDEMVEVVDGRIGRRMDEEKKQQRGCVVSVFAHRRQSDMKKCEDHLLPEARKTMEKKIMYNIG